jgi:ribosome-binding factor A
MSPTFHSIIFDVRHAASWDWGTGKDGKASMNPRYAFCFAGFHHLFSYFNRITPSPIMAPPDWRTARLAEQIRNEVEEIVTGELKDPRIGSVMITQVVLSPDLHHVRVLLTLPGDESVRQNTLEGLASSAGFVSHEVGRRLRMRRAPEVVFVPDRGAEAEQRVEELLHKLNRIE